MTLSDNKSLYLIDGSSYIYRAFYAIPHLSSPLGLPTNATFGFINMLLKIIKEFGPEFLAVAFDTKGPNFRHEIYPSYKANRPKMPDDLIPQIPYIKKLVAAFNFFAIEKAGYEADDIIGTIAADMEKKGFRTVLLSGDKDLLQLISDHTVMLDTMKNISYDTSGVQKRFGVAPHQVTDILGLSGDTSDNIPGVPGIGDKTAAKLIGEFGSIENLLKNLDKLTKKQSELLSRFADQAMLSKKLATIDTKVPLNYNTNDFKVLPHDNEELSSLYKELGFMKLLKSVKQEQVISYLDYHLITEDKDFLELVDQLEKSPGFSVDLETTSKDSMQAELVGISFSLKPHQAFYLPLGHSYPEVPKQLAITEVLEKLKPVLENEGIEKYGQNLKYDWIVLKNYGITMQGVTCDTMIASYLLNPSKHNHNLEDISWEHLDHKMITYAEVTGSGKNKINFKEVPLKKAKTYSCEDADVTYLLRPILLPRIKEENLEELYYKTEIPLISVLACMEMNGVKIDVALLGEMSNEFEFTLHQYEETIHQLAGESFNINSPQQLGKILFEKLQLPRGKKTKTGYSTDVNVLTKLAKDYELPREILIYRSLIKLKSTYIDALPKLINQKTGRIHTSYNQTVTATGRLSSSGPNLQNIPVRTKEGKRIREAFIPEKGWKILSADYSQIELRVLAHLSKDDTLMTAFKKDEDIHEKTAAEVFDVFPKMVTPEMRRMAKVINFGIIYGMKAFTLARELGVSNKKAQNYIDTYFARYHGVKKYQDETLQKARNTGFVMTLLNRRRYIPEIKSNSRISREFAERTAINAPIQGSAADLIKLAMINIHRSISQIGLTSKMIMQVHDELVFEVPEDEIRELTDLVRTKMEGAIELSIPLKVDISTGNNWAEAH